MGGRSSKISSGSKIKAGRPNKSSDGYIDSHNKKDFVNRFEDYSSKLEEKKLEEKQNIEKDSFLSDALYDGIPRYPSLRSRSLRSTQTAVAMVSEVSSRLGRAGFEVLDTLGSSMTNLNANSGFAAGVATKGNELSILAFEVANTIVKGSSLMQSFSTWNIKHLKEVVLLSEGVQTLISKDTDELMEIVEADKREELKIFSGEVVRFGNRCKDPQWHNLDRYFEKVSKDLTQKQIKEDPASVMEILTTLVQYTAELYHELQVLDRIEQQYQFKRQQDDKTVSGEKGDSLATLRTDLNKQKKLVRTLKKKSLWSRSLEQVMEMLVDIVNFLLLEIQNTFGVAGRSEPTTPADNHHRLGPAGLSLHYANVGVQIDTLVARSGSMPQNTRDSLYQNLPPRIKSALRSRLQSFHVKEELSIQEIKDEMEKTLQWLVPMSANTAKAHHGFGWVGEWANSGSDGNRRPTASSAANIIRIETLHHAYTDKTEACILELLLWLHHLAKKTKTGVNGSNKKLPRKSSISPLDEKSDQQHENQTTIAAPLPDVSTSSAEPNPVNIS